MTLAGQRKDEEVRLGRLDLELVRERIAASNTEDAQHILWQKLPEIAAALKINELNVGQDNLAHLIDAVTQAMKPRS